MIKRTKQILFRIYFKLEKIINSELEKRLKASLKFCGENVYIDGTCNILGSHEFEIGNNSSISSFTTIYSTYGIKIGENCLISSNCGISSVNHIQNATNRRLYDDDNSPYSKSVCIGNNVWIGMNACILPGVSIGDNSIIGSGSVVTKNIPPNEVWVGNPARFMKKLDLLYAS